VHPARRVGTATFYSPLRYPGGKRKLANFLALVFRSNNLLDGDYAEAYCGGAAVALSLLYGDYAGRIHLNDLDRGIHAFWLACRDRTDEMCRLVRDARLDLAEWNRQRAIYFDSDSDPLGLAFATLYLNRTNHSGVITGGVIGGKAQAGTWKLDARYRADDLIRRIERIGRWASRIAIYNLDGAVFLRDVVTKLPAKSLVYLDPPYYVKGQEMLYANYYGPEDHAVVAGIVRDLPVSWVVSYDDQPDVRALYASCQTLTYDIAYSASVRYRGREVAFFSSGLAVPDVSDPARLSVAALASYRVAET
jgi:DNA adenine methylase